MDIEQIFSTVGTGVSAVIVAVLTCIVCLNAKKREAEAKARKAEMENISSFAKEWKAHYNEEKALNLKLNEKIDELYLTLSKRREEIEEETKTHNEIVRKLKDEKNELLMKLSEASWNRCIKNGCQDRTPPRKRQNE